MYIDTNVSIISSSVQIADDSISDRQAGPLKPNNKNDQVKVESNGIVDQSENENKEKGVLRLLREGHFKGVSDVRLRINFYDEIKSMEQEKSVQVAEEKVSELIESVNSEMQSFLQINDERNQLPATIENLTNNFNSAVSQSLDEFLTTETPDKDNLISQLRFSFDELKSDLESAFNETIEPIAETPPDTVQNNLDIGMTADTTSNEIDVEPRMDTTQTIFRQFLAQLIDTFTTGLNKLETALEDIKVLPEISEPHGNGRAYDKFLAAYNELNGDTSRGDAQSRINPPVINTLT